MSVNMIRTSRELTPVERFKMTLDSGIEVIKNVPDGTLIPVDAWCEYEDIKNDGEVVNLLSILSDGKAYSCQSATFKRSFFDMVDLGIDNLIIVKTSGTTKAGRPFINCSLAM